MKAKKYLKGRVYVRVNGTQIARFLSVLLARGIFYENAKYEGNTLYMEIAAGAFREAVICGKKTGVRLQIVSKKGLPFLFFRHRRRKWTLVAVLPLLIVFLVLPRFVWKIEVDGLSNISRTELLCRLEELGIHEGMRRSDLHTEEVKNQLLLAHKDLSFASLTLEGTTLCVTVEEAMTAPMIVDRSTICDVVAKENGVIYSMVTESGTPLVLAGDVVQAGDVLIKGEMILQDDAGNKTYVPVRAAGEVYGKVTWVSECSIEKKYKKQIFEKEDKKGLRLRFGDIDIVLRWPFGIGESESVTVEEIWRLPFKNFFSVDQLFYHEYKIEDAEYTKEEMVTILEERLKKQEEEELERGKKIVMEEIWLMEDTKQGMRARLQVEMMENIGVTSVCEENLAE